MSVECGGDRAGWGGGPVQSPRISAELESFSQTIVCLTRNQRVGVTAVLVSWGHRAEARGGKRAGPDTDLTQGSFAQQ